MSYLVYRSDGIPLAEYQSLRVCRAGRFTEAHRPMVNDVFTIVTAKQSVSYCVGRVEGDKAFTIMAMTEDQV